MNTDLKKVVDKVKTAQGQLQNLLKDRPWVEEAKKYAERQSKDLKKILSTDVAKVRAFLDKERKELEKFQKQIPGEVKKLRKFVNSQKKELEKLLATVKKATGKPAPKKKSTSGSRKKKAPAAS